EIELHSSAYAAIEHGTETVTVVEGNGYAGDDLARLIELGGPVTRQVDGDFVAELCQRGRQSSDDIGQAAGFGKWHTLGCRKGDMHETSWREGDNAVRNGEAL